MRRRGAWVTVALGIAATPGLSVQAYDASRAGPQVDEFAAARHAKVLCSATFVSHRDPTSDLKWGHRLKAIDPPMVSARVDYLRQEVEMEGPSGAAARARFVGDQGCVILPKDGQLRFKPVAVESKLPPASTQPWPMGDIIDARIVDAGIDRMQLARGVDHAFSDPESLTTALLVVHRGQLIAERYGLDAHRDMQLESWSMGKSVTATLLGVLVQQGRLAVHDPAPIPEWRQESRRHIRILDLLRMSSGLRFSSIDTPREQWENGYPDHLLGYSAPINVFEYVIARPAEFAPNTVGRYRNVDPWVIGAIIRRTVEAQGEEYLTWPQRALFDRIGIRRFVVEPDPYGNLLLTGFNYGTARDWARLGLLYLNQGIWQGERILPAGWSDLVRTPAPAWKDGKYGGLFWLNPPADPAWPTLPADAYWMGGGGGQRVIIVPSLELVLVRFGHYSGDAHHKKSLDEALEMITKALPR